ncbi:MAG TPA: hypothetical protein VHE55_17230 [Fimbriimonadaceae bacterium]|nr:hypothetical protein [Fimbriimonadaceae bacterium]
MLAALALIALGGPTTVELIPTDDVWVYSHASDPMKDPYLRVWGAEGKDVAKDVNEVQDFSYSYLRFDLTTLPKGKITGATLTLTHLGHPGFDEAYSKLNPIKARPLPIDFREKTWDFSKIDQIMPEPGDKTAFGSGYAENIPTDDKEFKITVDLLKGPNDFRKYVESGASSASKSIDFALTASLDVEEMGQSCIYKIYSKDCENPAKRPVLKLTVEP